MHSRRFLQTHTFTRFAMTLTIALALGAGLTGCGSGDTTNANTSPDSQHQQDNGFILHSDETTIDVTTSASLLPAYSQGKFNLRLMGGWVDTNAAKAAGQESDKEAQKKKALQSIGVMKLTISAMSAEPGKYQLKPDLDGKSHRSGRYFPSATLRP